VSDIVGVLAILMALLVVLFTPICIQIILEEYKDKRKGNGIMKFITRMLGKKFGECIADGHRMNFVKHSTLGHDWDGQPYAKMYFECSRCGYEDSRTATGKEVEAIRTIKNAEFKD
jgi:hypothetical protein